MQLLKASFLLILLGLPLMGSDCGGTAKCAEQKNLQACNAPGTCKWRAAILESQKCDQDLPKVNPGEYTSPPPSVTASHDQKKCEAEGGIYTAYVAGNIYNTYASCAAPEACAVMQPGTDSPDGKNEEACNRLIYCKYIAAKIDPGVGTCVDESDTTLDCIGKDTRSECLSVVLGDDHKKLCNFTQTTPQKLTTPASCTLNSKSTAEGCPDVPATTVGGNKVTCEAFHGCFYTESGFIDNAKCKKFICPSNSNEAKSISDATINTYKERCNSNGDYCDYTSPVIEKETGECSDVVSGQ